MIEKKVYYLQNRYYIFLYDSLSAEITLILPGTMVVFQAFAVKHYTLQELSAGSKNHYRLYRGSGGRALKLCQTPSPKQGRDSLDLWIQTPEMTIQLEDVPKEMAEDVLELLTAAERLAS